MKTSCVLNVIDTCLPVHGMWQTFYWFAAVQFFFCADHERNLTDFSQGLSCHELLLGHGFVLSDVNVYGSISNDNFEH